MNVDKLQKYMAGADLDLCILVHPDTNLNYFVENNLSYGVLLIWQDRCELLASALDDIAAPLGVEVLEYKKSWMDDLAIRLGALEKEKLRIGVNKNSLTVKLFGGFHQKFGSAGKDIEFVDISEKSSNIRLVKSELELSKMRKAAEIADRALALLLENFRESGLGSFPREIEVALFLEAEIRKQGAGLSFPAIAAFGKNSAVPHHVPGLTRLGGDDASESGFLLLDFGAKFEGYCSDMTRMLYLGKPSVFELKKYEKLLNVQKSCVQLASVNLKCFDLDAHARQGLGKDAEFFIHTLGHGIGSEVHEKPRLSKDPKNSNVILEKMPFTIEPGVYYPEKFGLRIEDTCVFIDEKLEKLTKSSKELVILQLK
ncbi:aminopeptidase P family protein [archaeon]|jgi:Xaa-Pro aminopeptidase|nr:aminopeptidase P family protein [archaeon]MBT6697874.1 aminopeptidase P family protein [archaeon]